MNEQDWSGQSGAMRTERNEEPESRNEGLDDTSLIAVVAVALVVLCTLLLSPLGGGGGMSLSNSKTPLTDRSLVPCEHIGPFHYILHELSHWPLGNGAKSLEEQKHSSSTLGEGAAINIDG